MNFILSPDISEKKQLESKVKEDSIYALIVYNDDVNTF
ncbi:MAG: ATP-dependent Clp protease adaptor ClpS, partial [Sphingobacteriia bacterium]|nr:ATP-dependent Clp protease adaptor ClpS [Candidatus Fonsibacter lacus]